MIYCEISNTLYSLIIDILSEQKEIKNSDIFENYGAWIVRYSGVRIYLKNEDLPFNDKMNTKLYLMDLNSNLVSIQKVSKKENSVFIITQQNISSIEFINERKNESESDEKNQI
jgi:3-oxoacyl-ACP reductase-like protein